MPVTDTDKINIIRYLERLMDERDARYSVVRIADIQRLQDYKDNISVALKLEAAALERRLDVLSLEQQRLMELRDEVKEQFATQRGRVSVIAMLLTALSAAATIISIWSALRGGG